MMIKYIALGVAITLICFALFGVGFAIGYKHEEKKIEKELKEQKK